MTAVSPCENVVCGWECGEGGREFNNFAESCHQPPHFYININSLCKELPAVSSHNVNMPHDVQIYEIGRNRATRSGEHLLSSR
jgi:hypothetical protein